MAPKGHPELYWAVELADQLIDQVIELLVSTTQSPRDLVVNVSREDALRGLQQILHEEIAAPEVSRVRIWSVIGIIHALSIGYTLETTDPISCILNWGWSHRGNIRDSFWLLDRPQSNINTMSVIAL